MKDKEKQIRNEIKQDFKMHEEKHKQIEEMARTVCCFPNIMAFYGTCAKCDKSNGCKTYKDCKNLYTAGYRKIDKDSIVLSREELAKRDYEFRQIGYDECLRDNPKKDKYIKTLERKIDQLKAKLDQARKETAEKYNDKLVAIIQHLFDIGQIDFKAKIELLKENEKLAKQFGVEIKE